MSVLHDALGRLLPAQFEEVIFRLAIPSQYLSPPTVAQSTRALEVVRYVQQQERAEDLRAAIHRVGGFVPDATTTPTPQETTPMPATDLTTRPVHAAHRRGVTLLALDALALASEDDAQTALADLILDDVTYAEFPHLGGPDLPTAAQTVLATVKGALPTARVLPVRVTEFVVAVRQVTPDRRYCPNCHRLDLVRVAGRWSPQDGDYCLARVNGVECRGVLANVAFEADVVSWVDGTRYAPGTETAPDGTPLTDAAIRAWVQENGGALSPWTTNALAATRGALSLDALAGYLLRTGATRNPLATLDALANPRGAQIAMSADAMVVLCRKALESRGATTATAQTSAGTTEPVVVSTGRRYELTEIQRFRGPLVTLYPDVASVRRIVSDAGVRTSNINLSGAPRDIWHNALVEANAHGRIDAIVALALREYPNNPALRALGGA